MGDFTDRLLPLHRKTGPTGILEQWLDNDDTGPGTGEGVVEIVGAQPLRVQWDRDGSQSGGMRGGHGAGVGGRLDDHWIAGLSERAQCRRQGALPAAADEDVVPPQTATDVGREPVPQFRHPADGRAVPRLGTPGGAGERGAAQQHEPAVTNDVHAHHPLQLTGGHPQVGTDRRQGHIEHGHIDALQEDGSTQYEEHSPGAPAQAGDAPAVVTWTTWTQDGSFKQKVKGRQERTKASQAVTEPSASSFLLPPRSWCTLNDHGRRHFEVTESLHGNQ